MSQIPSNQELVSCRVCYESNVKEALITPCQCKGSLEYIHYSCLNTWIAESKSARCELCHVNFQLPPKKTTGSICCPTIFSKHPNQRIKKQIIIFAVIAPFVVLALTYICLVVLEYYCNDNFELMPTMGWGPIFLGIIMAIILAGYYICIYSVLEMQSQSWATSRRPSPFVVYNPNQREDIIHVSISENNANVQVESEPQNNKHN